MNKITAAYVRISTAKGLQKTDSQEHDIRRYCAARGWTSPEFYVDQISGAKASRPQLDRMLQDIRKGKISRVVCFKLDRMGRSLTHLSLLLDEMNRLGIPLICTSQGIDTSDNNPCGKFQLDVLKAVAEFERNLIRERVNAGLSVAKAKGVRLGRPATLEGRKNEVMALRERGCGIREISRQLNMPVASVAKVIKTAKSDI